MADFRAVLGKKEPVVAKQTVRPQGILENCDGKIVGDAPLRLKPFRQQFVVDGYFTDRIFRQQAVPLRNAFLQWRSRPGCARESRAEGGDERLPTFEWGSGGERGAGNGPVFYNIPEAWGTAPIGAGEGRRGAPWPALEGVSRAVVIDRGMPGGMIVPPWLTGILDSER